ncbi:hypothetical protein K432DRAFT_217012 [Lepidopterella palustris CBS 459.81]|uniref:Uncharacterized protein n=1 Tax=Lepidopterella palustris CBS 459.81 TaxID=1314670 RepID=A0A8E2EL34_9PEZI|nr:hypothetical protein K432DRAFT_217012 [Lepidopterella palustris CBS 459.81]
MHFASFLLAAFIGAAAAEPMLQWPRHYGGYSPSGVSSSSSSTAPTLSSSSAGVASSSSIVLSSTKGYSSGTGHTPSSTLSSYIPWSSSLVVPTGTGSVSTETLTTYTTTTVCPVTRTSGTQVITTLTTSTITITSCKGGCHHSTVAPTTQQTGSPTGPVVVPTTITTTIWSFCPVSTPVATLGSSTYYSTYLTYSLATKTITTSATVYPSGPAQSIVTPPSKPSSVFTPPANVVSTAIGAPSGSCPGPTTIYSTIYVTAALPASCTTCIKTYTITESGTTTCITVTNWPAPPATASSSIIGTGVSRIPVGTGSSTPHPYSSSKSTWYGSSTGPKPTGGYAMGW